ncbi:MAG: DUF1501 domain-containing protein [Acidobacteria bacterium]|nr:DUF1501 domain-containing protein [Acidobacteriota bacterium]MBS1867468.1 DUF1501 domain-containing protein [Acidobacteriota bacterium]
MSYECCEGIRNLKFSRRYFLRQGGIAMVGLSAMPAFLQRAAAATPTGGKKQLVVLFQRGAADGLNIVVPFGEPNYYRMRPSIAIPQPRNGGADTVVDLDGFFGLHPSLAALQPLFQKNQLAIVHAAGSPDPTRSHFDAQDFMESGTPGLKATEDGWLNRAIETIPEEHASPFRAVAMGPNLPRMLRGSAAAIALPDVKQFKVMAQSPGAGQMAEGGFEAMYSQTVDQALRGTGTETFEAIDMLRKADPTKYQPENGAQYPNSRLGQSLQQVGQLIKANIGVEVLFVDCGGWDTHVNQGNANGQLSNLLKDLGQGLAAFHRDMGDRMQDIVFVTMSEFGRTAKENGNRGTDHGHANCMFLMGGDVKGGRVYGKWPGLADHQLNEGRDLALTTDFRTVLSEVLAKHIGVPDLAPVFPGFDNNPHKFIGLIRS